jgi:hypothetical protein
MQKERMNRKQQTNGKQEAEVNKDLLHMVTVKYSCVFLLQAYTQTY